MTEQYRTRTREEQAKIEIGYTEITPGVKWALFAIGLFTLFGVPAMQTYRDAQQYTEGRRDNSRPLFCDILDALPQAIAAYQKHDGSWLSKALQANTTLLRTIEEYERDLKTESFLTHSTLPLAQDLLIRVGSGNENAYIGRDRWLFYRPGIDYCTGPGFLKPAFMARRADSKTQSWLAPQPDPRVAILLFHRQLAERDIQLVLIPTPDKATIHPEKFSSYYEGRRMCVQNPSYRQFIEDLKAQGVLVCDINNVLAQYRNHSGNAVYLTTDTHWRPEAMELAAVELAHLIEEKGKLSATSRRRYHHQASKEIENLGDIATMLRLRQDQGIFGKESVVIHPVIDSAGEPWRPDPGAEVLVLGDSFTNIYSLEMMNWGSGAGLAEQLSVAMNRSVDVILRNDDGAFATREILSRELARGEDRLAGKKFVIWQFASRELAMGDWKLLDMTIHRSCKQADCSRPVARELIVSGTVAAKSAAPRAGQIPYAHHVFTVDLTDLQVHSGILTEQKVGVYLFSMRNHQNSPAFYWPVGKRVKIRLQPWRPVYFARYGRINRTETSDLELERPWWGEVME